jgi:hypothetical protein
MLSDMATITLIVIIIGLMLGIVLVDEWLWNSGSGEPRWPSSLP